MGLNCNNNDLLLCGIPVQEIQVPDDRFWRVELNLTGIKLIHSVQRP